MRYWALIFMFIVSTLFGDSSLDEQINKSEDLINQDSLYQACRIMEKCTSQYPDDFRSWAFLGYYQGMIAGKEAETNIAEAGRWLEESFTSFDRAAKIDSLNPKFRFLRGVILVNLPVFMGTTDQGITDLEIAEKSLKESDNLFFQKHAVTLYYLLNLSYENKGKFQTAEDMWKKVKKEYQENQKLIQMADKFLVKLESAKEKIIPSDNQEKKDVTNLFSNFKVFVEQKNIDSSRYYLEEMEKGNNKDILTFKAKLLYLELTAADGYDEKIYENQNYRSKLALDLISILDSAVAEWPDSLDFRFLRGMMGIELPFFLKRLDQGMEDLEFVIEKTDNDSLKMEAQFYLGKGFQKKGLSYWTKMIADNDSSHVAGLVLDAMSPNLFPEDREEYNKPYAEITFHISFIDFIEPQVAVWIEDEDGKYIRTLYVSGFSKYVKEKQVVLPQWAEKSKFENIDAVSCASINAGRHVYSWDLKDAKGKDVKKGKYQIFVEICHWPTIRHEIQKVDMDLKKPGKNSVAQGKYIPFVKTQLIK